MIRSHVVEYQQGRPDVTGIRRKVNYPDPRDVCESIFAKMAAMQLNQTWFQPKGRPSAQEHRLRLKRPTPCVYAPVPLYIKLNPRPLLALATSAFFRGSLRFRPKNMAHYIFQLETELQNIPEAAPKASPSFSVSGKLAGPPIPHPASRTTS